MDLFNTLSLFFGFKVFKTGYSKDVLKVRCQYDMDLIPTDYNGIINIKTKQDDDIYMKGYRKASIHVYGRSSVVMYDSIASFHDESYGNVNSGSLCMAKDTSYIVAHHDSKVIGSHNSEVSLHDESFGEFNDSSIVNIVKNNKVICRNNSTVRIKNTQGSYDDDIYQSICLYDNSSVSIDSFEPEKGHHFIKRSIRAFGTSTVNNTSWDLKSKIVCNILLHDYATYISNMLNGKAKSVPYSLNVSGTKRTRAIIYDNMPNETINVPTIIDGKPDIESYIDDNRIERYGNKILMYKIVHKEKYVTDFGAERYKYVSDYDPDFVYEIGKTIEAVDFCEADNIHRASGGIYSFPDWRFDIMPDPNDYFEPAMLMLEVDINDVKFHLRRGLDLIPTYDIRAKKVKVLGEVKVPDVLINPEEVY